ncbi:MAG: RdgB/HAM1 family non-canonical purine NTP pyrophosphatase [Alphaproteobacteria bacterium]|nr:RdgB/HAM1 family non-canonical purine NTP pyrophosphatase [Alphaproteobacteria bacterium]
MTAAPRRLVVASHNAGKVREIGALLAPFGFDVVSAGTLGLPEPEETEPTFVGNAVLKAKAAAQASGLECLADDSGLEVTALDGAPGIYSARWAGAGKNFHHAMQRVWDELGKRGAADLSARFICVLALARPDGAVETFEGAVDGSLVWPPRGDKGFGYDPIFIAAGQTRTFGEMESAEKQPLTHRARAFAKLADRFR